jgi:hypothetical protein
MPPSPIVPPSATVPEQTCPATVQPVVPGGVGCPHTPTVAPCAFVQKPPQHSKSVAQTSPFCVQKEPLAQTPLRQSFEQHSPFALQALPVVWQAGLSGAQTPPVQLPLQH